MNYSLKPKTKILLMASYCSDNKECSDDLPCTECLLMSNIFELKDETIATMIGGYDYIRDINYIKNQRRKK